LLTEGELTKRKSTRNRREPTARHSHFLIVAHVSFLTPRTSCPRYFNFNLHNPNLCLRAPRAKFLFVGRRSKLKHHGHKVRGISCWKHFSNTKGDEQQTQSTLRRRERRVLYGVRLTSVVSVARYFSFSFSRCKYGIPFSIHSGAGAPFRK